MQSVFFEGQEPTIEAISLHSPELHYQGLIEGKRIWQTAYGDGVGLYFFPIPPDLPQNMKTIDTLKEFYAQQIQGSPAHIVNCERVSIDGVNAVSLILKIPQQPSGMTYIGSLTIPYKQFSYVLKVQCQERGMTGAREAVLFDKLLGQQLISIDENGNITGEWNPDAPIYDQEFPEHPLSRLRAIIHILLQTTHIDDIVKRQPAFELP